MVLSWCGISSIIVFMTKHRAKEPVQPYNVRFPKPLHKALAELAVKERRSLHEQIIILLEQALDQRRSGR